MSVSTPLKLYNTLSREREIFVPLDPDHVRLYVCGPTVYDFAHIGNARPLIVFDVLYRLLREKYGADHVKYVRNITDVDDKINARAAERAITIRELTEETNRVFQEDVAALNCLPPDVQPRATEHIAEMIAIIEKLIANGHAYAADGHVLFDVPSMPDYGALSRRPLDDMIAGARVDVAPYKKGEMDFVLWKPSKESEPGWDSPWGRGRPGWHLECSAMSHKHLGEMFDIHGGGIDLVFPHHENEIAQTRCAFGHDVMANVWMHNGFLQVEGEKMSKSLGNFVTIHELLHSDKFGGKAWRGEVLRLAMMRSHYRQPIDWTVKALEEAEKTLSRWYAILRAQGVNSDTAFDAPLRQAFAEALCDDLNIPRAMAELHAMAAKAEPRESDSQTARAEAEKLLRAANLLGLLEDDPAAWDQKGPELAVDVAEVEKLVSERLAARKTRNFAESDRLRDLLADMGVKLKDGKDKTTGEPTTEWEVAG
ncbi:cysteine--tRNA ligase [Rhodoblastus sp. 17X3]|uniref:cysteine--tRNA ligase n=1 Tax=Rhodoblastus sp. 17X3 TaxID=3047026 RepID=UPI0024B745D7|nr:cysteine--tRNA ligase [Rhodoblastus sp. 17X3]MDI9846950.1 cysteine--tRNA ligase [Rhodoblastus sp. 17X3]